MFPGMQPSAGVQSALGRVPDIIWDLGHESAGTEHMLLALIRNGPEMFHRHCQPAELEKIVLQLAPPTRPVEGERPREFPYTPAAVDVLKLAFAEAQRGGSSELELDHVVLGLIEEGTGVAAAAFRQVGIASFDDWVSERGS